MEKVLLMSVALTGIFLVILAAHGQSAAPGEPEAKTPVTLRSLPEQVVLYTLYRGPYDKVGPKIGSLFALAGQKGIAPRGQVVLAFLNNPELVSPEHYLTEIRIPVSADSLSQAGTLGEFTDVKKVSAMEVAMVVKPAGVAEPDTVFQALSEWMVDQGYIALEGPLETYLTMGPVTNYKDVKTEIMVPVVKSRPKK